MIIDIICYFKNERFQDNESARLTKGKEKQAEKEDF